MCLTILECHALKNLRVETNLDKILHAIFTNSSRKDEEKTNYSL